MGLKLAEITDATMLQMAKIQDKNKDGELGKEEYSIFQQEAEKALEKNKISAESYTNTIGNYKTGISGWLKDDDKVCTDTKNDGKIGFKKAASNVLKGFFGGIIKGIIQNPIKSVVGFALCTGAMILTGGALMPLMIGIGIGAGALIAGKGAYDAAKSTDDGETKKSFENVGTGASVLILSLLGIKNANETAAKAGVKSLQGLKDASWSENAVAMVKAIPESLKVSQLNAKGNILTWASALKGDKVIYKNSNATRSGVMVGRQTGNPVEDAYRVDLKGSVEEVLAKNPGLSYDKELGKYYVQTSWGAKSYIQNDNYMFVKYGPGDCNAVEGTEFYDTYINQAVKEATGRRVYINPEKLKPGEHISAAKDAPARFKIVPEGTKYVSAETADGTVEMVQPKSVLRIDGQGRPYQSTAEFMLKKVQLTPEQIAELAKVDPSALRNTAQGIEFLSRPENYSIIQEALIKNLKTKCHVRDNAEQEVISIIKEKPDVIKKLLSYKTSKNTPLLDDTTINTVLINTRETIYSNPEKLYAAIESDFVQEELKQETPNIAWAIWKELYY